VLALAEVKWCCGTFKGWYDSAGERGIGVLVDRQTDGASTFTIQSRSIDLDDEGPTDHPRPITLVTDVQIHFCPWCGRRLADVYRDAVDIDAARVTSGAALSRSATARGSATWRLPREVRRRPPGPGPVGGSPVHERSVQLLARTPGGTVVLVMVEGREWDGSDERLFQL
jgi:hypothetical protein